jgi:hypothetical protein
MDSSDVAAHCSKKVARGAAKFLWGLANTLIFKTLYSEKSTLNGGGENDDHFFNGHRISCSSLGTSE